MNIRTRTILMFASCCVFGQSLLGQTSTDTLQQIDVRARRNTPGDPKVHDFWPGQKVHAIDTATVEQYRLQSLANLLTQQEPVFVKSYGFNGLATLSFRGASPAQTSVLWDGVPIQNAALGMADVSALPVFLMDQLSIVYGSSAALWGSGNVGGALMIHTQQPVFDSGWRKLSVSLGTGSFGQYSGGVNAAFATRKWYFSLRVFAQNDLDNFPYTNMSGMRQNMANDQLRSDAALVQAARKIGNYDVINLSGWSQQYQREIPPALFETYSVKSEKDASVRLLASWNRKKGSNSWYVKTSIIKDIVDYLDPASEVKTNNQVYQYFQELGWKRDFQRMGQLLLFSPVQLTWMEVLPGVNKQQNKTALAGAYSISELHNRLHAAVNARGEDINGLTLLLPGANASFAFLNWMTLRANVQKTYRAPSLNELYYFPGGNTALKPEQGWNADAGYTLKGHTGNFTLLHDLSLFDRDIHDWIIWLGGAIWTPHNIAEVHSRGVETENLATWRAGKWSLHLGLNTAYVLATTVDSYIPNDGSVGKQIPYTPRYNGQVNAGFGYRRLTINYNHTYTGYRFITSDESEFLTPYQTGNLQVMYSVTVKRSLVTLTAQCNNIWNAQYQVVAERPMPGVNWLAGLSVGLL